MNAVLGRRSSVVEDRFSIICWLLVVAFLLTGATHDRIVPPAAGCWPHPARVLRVVDGDTVDVLARLEPKVWAERRIRLLRIDAPERGRPGYAAAKAALAGQLPPLTLVTVTVCGADSFGRWLAEIALPGLGNVSDWLLRQGLVEKDVR